MMDLVERPRNDLYRRLTATLLVPNSYCWLADAVHSSNTARRSSDWMFLHRCSVDLTLPPLAAALRGCSLGCPETAQTNTATVVDPLSTPRRTLLTRTMSWSASNRRKVRATARTKTEQVQTVVAGLLWIGRQAADRSDEEKNIQDT